MRSFDRKFGAEFVRELPESPGVYLFKDDAGRVLYAGKAVNLRRRLQSYRTLSRRKAYRKMRKLVREASALEVRLQPTERDALLLENELIRTLRPPYNVDGAYHFLYPAIGTASREHQTLLCFTTQTDAWQELGLQWHGVFRSRLRAREAFDALAYLLTLLGHAEPRSRLPAAPRLRGSRLVGFRRLPAELLPALDRLLAGESRDALARLAEWLVEKPQARHEAEAVQEHLRLLDDFHRREACELRAAQERAGRSGFVPQEERDALFIAWRSG